MKQYVHNPAVFRKHFAGQGLPAFKGARMQRGYGSFINKLKRFAVPLLMAGATAAAPHISKVAGTVAQGVARKIFPSNPAMQQVVGNVTGKFTNSMISKATGIQKKRKRKSEIIKKKKKRVTTSRNIFS